MVRLHATVGEGKIIHLEDRFQRNITIALKKLNNNRMEFCKSNQQLKYLAAVQRTGIYITFKELRLNDQKFKFQTVNQATASRRRKVLKKEKNSCSNILPVKKYSNKIFHDGSIKTKAFKQ